MRLFSTASAMLCTALVLFASHRPSTAQVAPVTRTLAITGATVVAAPGQVLEDATVLIRDGLITEIGPGVTIPYDARVLEADSLFVYAGFIDPLSYVGQEAPRPQGGNGFGGGGGGGQDQVADRGNPPFDRAGLEPYRNVRDLLDHEDASVKDLRSQGFTAAHAVPRGRMLPGSGAVVLLHGDSADQMILASDISMFVQFQGGRGVYPGTPMAMTAKMRQLYREAERRHALAALYADDPAGMERPPYDPVHAAFGPVIEGEKPVFFHVTDALEAHRALTLREELGFRLVLTGLGQGYDLADKLAGSGVSLAVTTDLPNKPSWMDSVKRDSLLELIENYDPDERTATWRDTEAELRSLEARQATAREHYLKNPATLHAAGARFAFTSLDTRADQIHANIREMLAAGLDTTVALAALTTNAADIIGMSRAMGSLQRGKLGNAVITTGPLFRDGTQIKHVVVEGTVYDVETESPRSGGRNGRAGDSGSGAAGLAGTWALTAETPEGDIQGSIEIVRSGGALRGWLTYDGVTQAIPVSEISEEGDEVSFSFTGPDGFISVTLTRRGARMSGTYTMDSGQSGSLRLSRATPD